MEDTIEKEKKTFVLNIMLDIITYKHVTITKYKNSDRTFSFSITLSLLLFLNDKQRPNFIS